MKHLTTLLLTLLVSGGLWADCILKDEYNPKIDFTFKKLYGTHDCVLDDIMKDDSMIAGYWLEDRSKTLFIVINNIRAGRDIDFDSYGYNQRYLQGLSKRINNAEDIQFKRRFSYNGAEQPQIESILRQEGFRR
tara:strand:+ start:28 stop:429 length:402 start_codon:yes stop_codon:yes gene_type:complete